MNPLATPPASRRLALALALLAGAPLAAQACSSCGCTLNSDWPTQGLSAARGLGVDLRHDFFNQNDLRRGSGRVDRATITFPTDTEVQQQTVNRNTTLTLDYGLTADWGVSVMLPWIDRFHTTIVDGDTDISTSRSSSLGDARVSILSLDLSKLKNSSSGKNIKLSGVKASLTAGAAAALNQDLNRIARGERGGARASGPLPHQRRSAVT